MVTSQVCKIPTGWIIAVTSMILITVILITSMEYHRKSWFSEDLPSPEQVAAWSKRDLDEKLFKLSRWEGFLGGSQFRRFVHSQIRGLNLSHDAEFRFLEVGVGVGAFCREVLSMFPAAYGDGIDVVPGAIAIASIILPKSRVNVSIGDMLSLDYDNDAFDVVFVPGAICYLSTMSDVRRAVAEFVRVLRISGGICLSMIASDVSPMGSCNVRIPKEYWLTDTMRENDLKVVSMEEMDSWNLPHSYGRYATCLRKGWV